MRKIVLFSIILGSSLAFGEGSDLLLGKNGVKTFTPIIKNVKKIILDDPFVVQAYGSLRVLGTPNQKITQGFDYLFEKNYEKAITQISKVDLNQKNSRLINSTKIYLFYKLGLAQNMVNLWIEESTNQGLSNTQLGVSLDQVIGKKSSQWILKNSIFLTKFQLEKLDRISNDSNLFNYSLQAYANLRSGMKGFKYLGKLSTHDPLRFKLANTIVIAFAKNDKLAEAGKIVKEIIEPVINKTNNTEKIARYYLTLGRLLYQAGAYKASKQYYNSIPDTSPEFLKSRVESLWVSMVNNDHSVILGELKSLELKAFEAKFLPELHLVSSMANLQLCQFSAVEKSFKKFIRTSKDYLKQDINIKNSRSEYLNRLVKFQKKSNKQIKKLIKLNLSSDRDLVKEQVKLSDAEMQDELNLISYNRKSLIESALRNMRFVKIEYLSTMRRLSSKLASSKNKDHVSTMTSAIDKSDRLEFPYDGVLFGDELFHMRSRITNLCLKENNK